ncbi:MAG TPA: hypothetical protein VGP72_22535 [Planctomycetota bacterium]|jgi:outer membrane biosynthesis protein TonB
MEVLVQLVIALLRALFGDPEKGPEISPTRRPPGKAQRGPYSYGDSGGNRPKTLEEILADVRREAQQRQTGAPPAPPPPVPQASAPLSRPKPAQKPKPVQPPPPKPAPARTFRPTFKEEPAPVAAPAPAPVPPPQTTQPVQPAVSSFGSISNVATIDSIVAPAAKAVIAMDVSLQDRKTVSAISSSALDLLRGAAQTDRSSAAREAFILMEVLGPPRSRRPHRLASFTTRGEQDVPVLIR